MRIECISHLKFNLLYYIYRRTNLSYTLSIIRNARKEFGILLVLLTFEVLNKVMAIKVSFISLESVKQTWRRNKMMSRTLFLLDAHWIFRTRLYWTDLILRTFYKAEKQLPDVASWQVCKIAYNTLSQSNFLERFISSFIFLKCFKQKKGKKEKNIA